MKQIARKLTDCLDGFLKGYRYLIHDRGSQFSSSFRMILLGGGVKTIRLPRRSPNLNAFAERWVRTAKELCIDRMIFFGESSLRKALSEVEIFYAIVNDHIKGSTTRSSSQTLINRRPKERLSVEADLEECSTITTEKQHEDLGNRLLGPYGLLL